MINSKKSWHLIPVHSKKIRRITLRMQNGCRYLWHGRPDADGVILYKYKPVYYTPWYLQHVWILILAFTLYSIIFINIDLDFIHVTILCSSWKIKHICWSIFTHDLYLFTDNGICLGNYITFKISSTFASSAPIVFDYANCISKRGCSLRLRRFISWIIAMSTLKRPRTFVPIWDILLVTSLHSYTVPMGSPTKAQPCVPADIHEVLTSVLCRYDYHWWQ